MNNIYNTKLEVLKSILDNAMNIHDKKMFFAFLNQYITLILAEPAFESFIRICEEHLKKSIVGKEMSFSLSLNKLIAFHNIYHVRTFDKKLEEVATVDKDMELVRLEHNTLLRYMCIQSTMPIGIFTSLEEYKYHMENVFYYFNTFGYLLSKEIEELNDAGKQ